MKLIETLLRVHLASIYHIHVRIINHRRHVSTTPCTFISKTGSKDFEVVPSLSISSYEILEVPKF
jgi:hypothetical protein